MKKQIEKYKVKNKYIHIDGRLSFISVLQKTRIERQLKSMQEYHLPSLQSLK